MPLLLRQVPGLLALVLLAPAPVLLAPAPGLLAPGLLLPEPGLVALPQGLLLPAGLAEQHLGLGVLDRRPGLLHRGGADHRREMRALGLLL